MPGGEPLDFKTATVAYDELIPAGQAKRFESAAEFPASSTELAARIQYRILDFKIVDDASRCSWLLTTQSYDIKSFREGAMHYNDAQICGILSHKFMPDVTGFTLEQCAACLRQ